MSYAGKFLLSKGQDCTILRDIPVSTKVSMKRSTKSSRDLGSREAYWEGLILSEVNLQSGEVFSIGSDYYLVQSVSFDPESHEHIFFAAKCNAVLTHKRYEEHTDDDNNVIQEWVTLHDNIHGYIEVVTYQLRQFDPGLLDQTRYITQVPKSLGSVLLDRYLFDGGKYEVVSIDSSGMEGVSRLQLGADTRQD
jgi:hypothetical protein